MKSTWRLIKHVMLVVAALAASMSSVLAAEFKSVGAAPIVMYDAPTVRGQKLYVAPRGMPVEVVINYGAWSKVRDFAGDLSWVESKQLTDRKNVVVKILNAKVRSNPSDASPVIFSADKGVLLEVVDTSTPSWIKVQHSDGSTGYVRSGDVWGV
jgi:SH3-like domain-containing protein